MSAEAMQILQHIGLEAKANVRATRLSFEGRTAQELSENTLVKQYSLGV